MKKNKKAILKKLVQAEEGCEILAGGRRKKPLPEYQKPVKRWALWSPVFGFLLPLPHQTELLFTSRADAIASKLNGSWHNYNPVKVELRPLASLKFR